MLEIYCSTLSTPDDVFIHHGKFFLATIGHLHRELGPFLLLLVVESLF